MKFEKVTYRDCVFYVDENNICVICLDEGEVDFNYTHSGWDYNRPFNEYIRSNGIVEECTTLENLWLNLCIRDKVLYNYLLKDELMLSHGDILELYAEVSETGVQGYLQAYRNNLRFRDLNAYMTPLEHLSRIQIFRGEVADKIKGIMRNEVDARPLIPELLESNQEDVMQEETSEETLPGTINSRFDTLEADLNEVTEIVEELQNKVTNFEEEDSVIPKLDDLTTGTRDLSDRLDEVEGKFNGSYHDDMDSIEDAVEENKDRIDSICIEQEELSDKVTKLEEIIGKHKKIIETTLVKQNEMAQELISLSKKINLQEEKKSIWQRMFG